MAKLLCILFLLSKVIEKFSSIIICVELVS